MEMRPYRDEHGNVEVVVIRSFSRYRVGMRLTVQHGIASIWCDRGFTRPIARETASIQPARRRGRPPKKKLLQE
jgi:hypothetical protein